MTISHAAARELPRTGRPPLRIRYASFEARVAAAILDLLVLFIIASLLVTAGAIVVLISSDFERSEPSSTSLYIFWGAVGAIVPAFLLYFFLALAWKGQTVGGAVMQIMVLRSDGRALGALGAAARVIAQLSYLLIVAAGVVTAYVVRDSAPEAAAAVGVAFLLAALGFVWAAFDSHRRALHDRIAGTIVVHVE
jgi:uncharacterized RDD family membrane protein YckC